MARKEFNENSGLGFMRVIVVLNILAIITYIFSLTFVIGSTVTFDLYTISGVSTIVFMSIVTWLILTRRKGAQKIIIILLLIDGISSIILDMMSPSFTLIDIVFSTVNDGLMILYFATSRRAKAVLVKPFDFDLREKDVAHDYYSRSLKSRFFWARMLLYFFAFSIMGHWMEMGVQILVVNGLMPGTVAAPDSLTWRDSLNPFPIYGIAVVICGLVLYPLYLKCKEKMPKAWQALAVSFLANTLFCVVAELILGYLFNADHHAWDYSNQPFNLDGQICLLYTILFGIVSSAITWLLYPTMERQFSYVTKDAFRLMFLICVVLYLIIFFTYNLDPMIMFGFGINATSIS